MIDSTTESLVRHYFQTTALGTIFEDDVMAHCRLFDYEAGEMVCEKDLPLTKLIFIVEGAAKVFTMLDNGKIYLLRIEEPLNIYGDLEVFTGDSYTANVEALAGCRCLGMPINLVRRQYANKPEFLRMIITSLANRLDKISHMSTTNLLLPLKNKVAGYLVAHMDEKTGNITIKTSYIEVAEQLGSTYRHLSRVMKELVDDGYIRKKGKKIVVEDMDALAKLGGNSFRY